MAEKVYGIWDSYNGEWWIDGMGRADSSVHRGAMLATLAALKNRTLGWQSATVEIIGENGLPERPCTCRHWPCICPVKGPEKEEPKADLLPVAHPCPFCGNGPIDMDVRGCGQSHRVQCLRCNAQGPSAGSDRTAIEEWNIRTP